MHHHDLSRYQHQRHDYELGHPLCERRAWTVVGLTAAMMVAEIAVGLWAGSMALLADGWHMATHAVALGVTAVAYRLARRESRDSRYAFGTWKIEVLGGFASAIVLGMVALYVALESVLRAFGPVELRYTEALWVAALGLAVNLVCALILHDDPSHAHPGHADQGGHAAHGEPHEHVHEPGRAGASHAHDLNLRAAYLHVLSDALTSLLAIGALLGARWLGWIWLDPAMGLVGALLIAGWSFGLLRETGKVLLDREMSEPLVQRVKACLQGDDDTRVADLHLWRVGRAQYACVATLVSDEPREPMAYRGRLAGHSEIVHVTIEVLRCRDHEPAMSS